MAFATYSSANTSPPHRNPGFTFRLAIIILVWIATLARSHATLDLRFDVVTFCCDCSSSGSLLCQSQLDHMNFPTLNGHVICMGSDAHRSDLYANGNQLGIYYDTLNNLWATNTDGVASAAVLDQYALSLFTSTGPKPNWIVLNEISGSIWPTSQAYRTWVATVVHTLHVTYGYSVILFAPFANPAANSSDWQAVSADAYIGIENYLSGQEIQAQSFSVSWCQGQYQSSITNYTALGVAKSRLILGEHFAQSVSGSGFGRSGVTSNAWDSALIARSQAAQNAGFPGFIGYAWDKDGMNVTSNEMIHFEDTYASFALPAAEMLTAPFLLLQPQSLAQPPGATVTFTAIPAGIAPHTYQWRFMNNNISGATSSSLTLTNISPLNAGNYSLVLSNAAGLTVSSNAVLSVQTSPPLVFEPFASAVASNGTAYAIGANLIGQTNAQGIAWVQAGATAALTNQPLIIAGNLDATSLADPSGNSVRFGGGGGMGARLPISPGTSSGTIYYSFTLKLTNITGLSSSGVFWAGFNNSSAAQTTMVTVVGARVYTRAATGGFNLGLSKSSGTATDWQWDTTVHKTNELIFVVGSYTVNTNSTIDDSSSMWINPAAATFGTATAPSPTLTATSGSDISSVPIVSFVLFNRDPTEPAGGIVDELRIGTSWASVTPPSGPAPTLSIVNSGANVILSWPTNSTAYNLQFNLALDSTNIWRPLNLPTNIVNGQFTVTNTLSAGAQFYRLEKP